MTPAEFSLHFDRLSLNPEDSRIIDDALSNRNTAHQLASEQRYLDALERIVEALRTLREFSTPTETEFRALVVALLFDLSELHFSLKDYKQSEKELEMLFKLLENLIKIDAERFGKYHILAMELSTRILRSRKKALETLVKHQLNTEQLYEKVNSGVVEATDKLVDSLRNVGELLASAGDYRAAMKFYAEAIKFSKKRNGRVTRKEVKMTVEMAKIMMRVRQMRPRAKRLLNAILPHAIALETIQLEEDILALIEIIDTDIEKEPLWKSFIHSLSLSARSRLKKNSKEEETEARQQLEITEDEIEAFSNLEDAQQEMRDAELKKKGKKNKK